MHLKSSLYLIFMINLLFGCYTPTLSAIFTPKNLIIATDLDDVLFAWRKGTMLKLAIKDMRGLKKYMHQAKKRRKLTGSFGFKFGETLYIDALEKGNSKAADFLRTLAAQKRIKKGTLHIYQELADAGHLFYTATNIGEIFFDDLQKAHPAIFNDAFIRNGLTVDYGASEIIEKPDARYFEQLKKTINPAHDQHILFIDDRIENVEAARACGLEAIQFKNRKQLIRDLHAYNICLCSGSYKYLAKADAHKG